MACPLIPRALPNVPVLSRLLERDPMQLPRPLLALLLELLLVLPMEPLLVLLSEVLPAPDSSTEAPLIL